VRTSEKPVAEKGEKAGAKRSEQMVWFESGRNRG
jgi:hypothetical protein